MRTPQKLRHSLHGRIVGLWGSEGSPKLVLDNPTSKTTKKPKPMLYFLNPINNVRSDTDTTHTNQYFHQSTDIAHVSYHPANKAIHAYIALQ